MLLKTHVCVSYLLFRAAETSQDIESLRPPRFIHEDGVIRPYKEREGLGSQMLQVGQKSKTRHSQTWANSKKIFRASECIHTLSSGNTFMFMHTGMNYSSICFIWMIFLHNLVIGLVFPVYRSLDSNSAQFSMIHSPLWRPVFCCKKVK